MAAPPVTPRDLPAVSQTVDANVRVPLARTIEEVQRLLGFRGDKLDKAITYREAQRQGWVDGPPTIGSPGGGTPGGGTPGGGGTPDPYEPDYTAPPTPTGLAGSAGFSNIILTWDAPTYTQGHSNAQTTIYAVRRALPASGAAPTFGDASVVSSVFGRNTITALPSELNTRWHVWIKWKSVDGVESVDPAGGINGLVLDTGQDINQLLTLLNNRITRSQLYTDIGTPIDLVTAADSVSGSVNARVKASTDAAVAALALEAGYRVSGDSTTLGSAQTYTQTWAYNKAATDSAVAAMGNSVTVAFGVADGIVYANAQAYVGSYAYSRATIDGAFSTLDTTLRADFASADHANLLSAQAYTTSYAYALGDGTALAGALTSFQSGVSRAGGNLLSNSGFEVAAASYGFANGWDVYNNSYTTEPSTLSLVAGRLGGRAARVAWTGTNTSSKGVQAANYFITEGIVGGVKNGWAPSNKYVISWWARAAQAWPGVGMQMAWNTAPASFVTLLNPSLSNGWQRYAVAVTMGSAVESSGRLYLTCQYAAAITGWLEFDDVQVQEGDLLTGYAAGDEPALTAGLSQEAITRASAIEGAVSSLHTTLTAEFGAADSTNLAAANNYTISYAYALADGTALAGALTTFRSSVGGAGGNLLANSSFEVDTDGDGIATGWAEYLNPSLEPAVYSLVPGRLGGLAQRISWTGTNTNVKGFVAANFLTGGGIAGGVKNGWTSGKKYVISWWSRASQAWPLYRMQTAWNVAPASTTAMLNPPMSANWQRYAFAVTMDATAEAVGRLYITCEGNAPITGWLDYDDVQVQEGDILTGYAPGDQPQLTAALQQESIVRASVDGGLLGQATLKIDLNGYIAGWGLASTVIGGAPSSSFIIRAGSFAIASPSGPGITPIVPFTVNTVPLVEDGVTIPPGIWGDAAYFRNVSALIAKFGVASIDDAKIASLSVVKLTAGALAVGEYISSTGFVSGSAGFNIAGNGNVELNNLTARGTIYAQAAHIQGQLTAGQIIDIRTGNYAEDGSGNPTAGAKMATAGTALKVANSGLQIGTARFTDYWARLVQAIDGNAAGGTFIWRGNNDTTTRGGAPNIDCLGLYIGTSTQTTVTDTARFKFQWVLQPTVLSDNLDSMRHMVLGVWPQYGGVDGLFNDYTTLSDRLYRNTTHTDSSNASRGQFEISYKPGHSVNGETASTTAPNLFSGHILVTILNAYGESRQKWFHGVGYGTANAIGAQMAADYTPPGGSPTPNPGGGSGPAGGGCPAPWVKVRLQSGIEVEASQLHNGARLQAVNDTDFQPVPGGGVVRDFNIQWSQRVRMKLTNGKVSEWSMGHRFNAVGRGWLAVQHLRAGDHLAGLEESVVESIFAVGEGQTVSWRVEGAGTYFAAGLLCHNLKPIP